MKSRPPWKVITIALPQSAPYPSGRLTPVGDVTDSSGSSHMEVQLQMPNLLLDQTGLGHPRRVLLVDQSDDSRDVIRTVLERRGVEILDTPTARTGLELLRQHRPDVIVLDLDAEAAEDAQIRAAYDSELASNPAEMVILGNLRQDHLTSDRHVVPKPYHYGPLIEMIEQLVQQSATACP